VTSVSRAGRAARRSLLCGCVARTSRSPLAQGLHALAVFLIQFGRGLVARCGELGERQAVQAIDDLVDRHVVILTA